MEIKKPVIGLNYIYISKHHSGGKDQVALNLLEGIVNINAYDKVVVICYDYLVDVIRGIAPNVAIESIKSRESLTELKRMLDIVRVNTFVIPRIIRRLGLKVIFHASYNNGLKKLKNVNTITLPHDIKAVSHRVIGKIRIPFYKYIAYRLIYKLDFKHADRIISISNADLCDMDKYYPQYRDKMIRIYNPIKVHCRDSHTITSMDKEQKRSGIVAINLQFHHKNIITLIKAYEKIMDSIEDDLILIGDVPERVQYIKTYVTEHDLSERVKFTGFVSGEEKREYLRKCRLYVNPSLFEGFGMTAVEAMILKAKVLVAKVSANYEVTKGLCNYYYPADSVEALSNAILQALVQKIKPEKYEEISHEIYESYNHITIAKEYMSLFMSFVE